MRRFGVSVVTLWLYSAGAALAAESWSVEPLEPERPGSPLANIAVTGSGEDEKALTSHSFVSGLASFVEDRVDAELRAWATTAVVRSLCRDEVQAVFPATCEFDREGLDLYAMPGASDLLVQALRRDVSVLPANLLILTDGKLDWLAALLDLARRVERGDSPLALLAGLHRTEVIVKRCQARDTNTCDFIVASLLVHAWQSTRDEPAKFREHLVTLAGHTGIPTVIERVEDSLASAELALAQFQRRLAAIEDLRTRIRDAKEDAELRARLKIALLLEVRATLVASLEASGSRLAERAAYLKTEWFEAAGQVAAGEYRSAVLNMLSTVDCQAEETKRVCRVLPVALRLAAAESEADIASFLDAYAAPIGSWRGRQLEPAWYLAAWPAVAIERSGWGSAQTADEASIIAPVGIGRSWPDGGWWGDLVGSQGLLLSVLDIGYLMRQDDAVAVGGGQLESEDYGSASDLLSLGLYYRATIRGTPLSVGVGYSKSPDQRRLVSGATTRSVDTERFVLWFGMEITLLPLR